MMQSELRDLLERATDRITPVDLAHAALAGTVVAHRRRRAYAAGVAAASVLVVVFVGLTLGNDGEREPSPAPSPTVPSPSPTQETVRAWDPRKVDELPAADDDIAPALPAVVDPPASAPALSASPLEAAILSVELDGVAMLLGTDGTWRSVPLVGYEHADLSPAGTALVVSTGEEATVWDLGAGDSIVLPLPEGHLPWDYQRWRWLDDSTLLFTDGGGGFVVDPSTGAAERVPYPDPSSFFWTVDPSGAVIDSTGFGQPPELTEWVDGEARSRDLVDFGHLAGLVAGSDTIAGTTYDGKSPGFRVVAIHRDNLELRSDLLVGDFEGNYSNGALGSVAMLGEDVVLLRVTKISRSGYEGWRFVAWQVESGELGLVTRVIVPAAGNVTLATELLD